MVKKAGSAKLKEALETHRKETEGLLTSPGNEGVHNAVPIPLFLGKDASVRIQRARAAARYAIVALLVSGTCVLGWTTFTRWAAAGDLAAIEQAIVDRRALLLRASGSHDAAGRGGLLARRVQGPLAVLVLERLSGLLPDDTHLTDLSLDGERLRFSGISGQAAELVPLLEKSGFFRNASFYAPTTRMAGQSADRFSIEAAIVSGRETKP